MFSTARTARGPVSSPLKPDEIRAQIAHSKRVIQEHETRIQELNAMLSMAEKEDLVHNPRAEALKGALTNCFDKDTTATVSAEVSFRHKYCRVVFANMEPTAAPKLDKMFRGFVRDGSLSIKLTKDTMYAYNRNIEISFSWDSLDSVLTGLTLAKGKGVDLSDDLQKQVAMC